MGTTLPERGRSWDGLREEMLAMRREDLDWRRGRHSVYVWYAHDELEMVLRQAYSLFLVENGLGLRAFPSLRRMEDLWAFAFGSDEVDMHRVAARMNDRGWYCGRTTSPRGMHMMCTPVHEKVADEYVADVALAVDEERARASSDPGAARYS